ncbi:MAG: helix-turn-helix domain-containing protein [Clostridiales bacterium]|jgi:AcrR family transcriptional regulator|nr:TetR/AcrR family transcriptional regulator [Eubacteriales bacterium]MDH7565533.1 helix-turn-helix domain-containing protein [Clostridiales bacterium]
MDIWGLSGEDIPEKERRILEAAIKIFSEKGYSASTTSEIAKSAGVAEGTIFRYFKTKKDILRGILIHAVNILSGRLVIDSLEKIMTRLEEKDLRTVLKQILVDRLKLADSLFPMVRVLLTEALYHEDVREALYQNIVVRALTIAEKFHREMVQKGMMRDDIDHVMLLRAIMANVAALVAQRKIFEGKIEVNDMGKEIDTMIDVLMYGIAKQTGEDKKG